MAASISKTQVFITNFRCSTGTHYLFPRRCAAISIFGTMTIYLPNALKEVNGNIDMLADELDKLFLTEFVCLCASGTAVISICEKLNNCPIIDLIPSLRN